MKKSRLIALILTVVLMISACGAMAEANIEWVHIVIDEWPGYKSLLDANGGLRTAPGSLNAQRGIYVEYHLMNSHIDSSNALIAGEVVGAGYTVNRFAYLHSKFEENGVDVVVPFITNYSNGSDGIVATSDILSVNDLVGKTIAVPEHTEAQTLVEWLLRNSSLTDAERDQIRSDMVYFTTPEETGQAFIAGRVDAAGTWEPFISTAIDITDGRVLFDTSMSTNLILSAVMFRQDFLDTHEEFMTNYIDAALEAAAMYKTDFTYAREMPLFSLMTDEEILQTVNGANLTTWSQNAELLNNEAISMYEEMAEIWISVGAPADPARAKTAFTDKYIQNLRSKYEGQETEVTKTFSEEERSMLIESPESLLSYSTDIKFELDSFEISNESYEILDEFVEVARVLDGAYIQIEGNTSKRASERVTDEMIIGLSESRAQAVANYFEKQGIASERLIVIGHGDSNPLNKENTAAAENRRTEIFFKAKMGY